MCCNGPCSRSRATALQANLHGPGDTSGVIAISEPKQGYWQGGNPAVTEHVNRVAQSANAIPSASASGHPMDRGRREIEEGTAHQRCPQVELIENPLRHRTFAHVSELVERALRPQVVESTFEDIYDFAGRHGQPRRPEINNLPWHGALRDMPRLAVAQMIDSPAAIGAALVPLFETAL